MAGLLVAPDLPRLGAILWQYRRVFDRLHFLIETEILLITSGRDHQLHHMVDLLDETIARLGRLDLEREIVLGVGPDGAPPRLTDLMVSVEAPWDEILREHHEALEGLVATTNDLVRKSGALIRRVQADLPDVATILGGDSAPSVEAQAAGTYGRNGRSAARGPAQAYLFENRI